MSQSAHELRARWWTIMNAVIEHGTPRVDDPDRIGGGASARDRRDVVPRCYADESELFATGLIDLERHAVIELVDYRRPLADSPSPAVPGHRNFRAPPDTQVRATASRSLRESQGSSPSRTKSLGGT